MDKEWVAAILLMAGKGERFGCAKQFTLLGGKELYLHALAQLEGSQLFNQIVLVCWQEHVEQLKQRHPLHTVVAGGSTRALSSYAGLKACSPNTKYVLIHDAARPFVSERILKENIKMVQQFGAVNTCIASADTIVCGQSFITTIPDRSSCLRGQTPQTFLYQNILKAHQTVKNLTTVTDDCKLVLQQGLQVAIALGEEVNFKITTPLDLFLAQQLINSGGCLSI